jgi:hypothetical protein
MEGFAATIDISAAEIKISARRRVYLICSLFGFEDCESIGLITPL